MNNIQVDVNDFALDAPVVTKIEMEVMEMVLDSHVTMVVHYLNANGNLLDNKIGNPIQLGSISLGIEIN